MEVTQSVLLYGAEVLTDALGKKEYRQHFAQVQDLRVTSAHSTVFQLATVMTAEAIPIALLAKECTAVFSDKGDDLREVVAGEEQQRTITMAK